MEMSGVIKLTRRNKMIIDQNYFIRIPELLKSHFFEFLCNKWNKNIMDHHSVYIDSYNIAWFYGMTHIVSYNLFDNCFAHLLFLLSPVHSVYAWLLQVHRPG